MPEKMKCKIVSFEEVYEMAKLLSEKVKSSNYEPTTVVGLARGGWIPARLMCDFLGITDLISLKVEHWLETGKTKDEATIKYPITSSMTEKKILIIDDITDTGKSIITSIEYLKKLDPEEIRIGVMQYIPQSECKPDYYGEKVTEWTWFIYPWNLIEDISTLIVRLMSDEEEKSWNINTIASMFQEYYSIKVSKKMLKFVIKSMHERRQIKIEKTSKTLRYKLKKKSVIRL
jgi:hypoxanthine phosphoribosyltransferase